MPQSGTTRMNYESLWTKTVSAPAHDSIDNVAEYVNYPQVSTLMSLEPWRLSWFRFKTVTGGQVIVGGYGDVVQAKLRPPTGIFGADTVIALKKLRPSGDRGQRIRVMAVSSWDASRQAPKLTICQSLARELDVWSKLSHPNILKLEGFYIDEHWLTDAWIATPWQDQGNISKYLEATRPALEIRLKLVSEFTDFKSSW